MYKKGYASRSIRGKLKVCGYLSSDPQLKRYVPRTMSFNKSHMNVMSDKYQALYIKPDVGSLGMGIFKLRRLDRGYELKEIAGRRQLSNLYPTISSVYDRISKRKKGAMIIQQAISLDRLSGRPYDIRAMVQRKTDGSWTCSGFLVKVGAADKIVTNYYQGGEIYSLGKLFKRQGLTAEQSSRRKSELKAAALHIANALSSKRAGMKEMGIDFAYDQNHQLWVLEVNSNHPQYHPLKNVDRSAYNRMKALAAGYGRYSDK